MYRLMMTVAALAAWLLAGHFGLFAILAYVWISAMATTNTSKTRDVENRVDAHTAAIGNLNKGVIANVGGTGQTVQLTGGGTLNAPALSQLNNASNTSFLAGLSQMPSPSSPTVGSTGGWDGNTGSSWATGERGYTNGLYDSLSTFYGWIRNSGLAG